MKVHKIDLNLDVTNINEKFLIQKPTPAQEQEYNTAMLKWHEAGKKGDQPKKPENKITPARLVANILEVAISTAHPQGNKDVLRRTKEITAQLDVAIEKNESVINLSTEDFKYLRSSFDKTGDWSNNKDTANLILAIDDLLNKAQEVEI